MAGRLPTAERRVVDVPGLVVDAVADPLAVVAGVEAGETVSAVVAGSVDDVDGDVVDVVGGVVNPCR